MKQNRLPGDWQGLYPDFRRVGVYIYASDKLAFWNPHTMNDLALIMPEQLPGALTPAEIDATMAYAEAEKALATRSAYASDWRDFAAWCALSGATALPAHQGIVAAYLSSLADSGRKASTIGRRAAVPGRSGAPSCALSRSLISPRSLTGCGS